MVVGIKPYTKGFVSVVGQMRNLIKDYDNGAEFIADHARRFRNQLGSATFEIADFKLGDTREFKAVIEAELSRIRKFQVLFKRSL